MGKQGYKGMLSPLAITIKMIQTVSRTVNSCLSKCFQPINRSNRVYPFPKFWRFLLAHNNIMMNVRGCKLNKQFHFIMRLKSPDEVDIDDILAICTVK